MIDYNLGFCDELELGRIWIAVASSELGFHKVNLASLWQPDSITRESASREIELGSSPSQLISDITGRCYELVCQNCGQYGGGNDFDKDFTAITGAQ